MGFSIRSSSIMEVMYGLCYFQLEGLMSEFTGDSFGQLEDIYGQTVEMQRFVQNAYEMNTNTFLERTKIV